MKVKITEGSATFEGRDYLPGDVVDVPDGVFCSLASANTVGIEVVDGTDKAPAAPVVAPPAPVPAPAPAPQGEDDSEQDDGSQTVKWYKSALKKLGVKLPKDARKSDLVKLYEEAKG